MASCYTSIVSKMAHTIKILVILSPNAPNVVELTSEVQLPVFDGIGELRGLGYQLCGQARHHSHVRRKCAL